MRNTDFSLKKKCENVFQSACSEFYWIVSNTLPYYIDFIKSVWFLFCVHEIVDAFEGLFMKKKNSSLSSSFSSFSLFLFMHFCVSHHRYSNNQNQLYSAIKTMTMMNQYSYIIWVNIYTNEQSANMNQEIKIIKIKWIYALHHIIIIIIINASAIQQIYYIFIGLFYQYWFYQLFQRQLWCLRKKSFYVWIH